MITTKPLYRDVLCREDIMHSKITRGSRDIEKLIISFLGANAWRQFLVKIMTHRKMPKPLTLIYEIRNVTLPMVCMLVDGPEDIEIKRRERKHWRGIRNTKKPKNKEYAAARKIKYDIDHEVCHHDEYSGEWYHEDDVEDDDSDSDPDYDIGKWWWEYV